VVAVAAGLVAAAAVGAAVLAAAGAVVLVATGALVAGADVAGAEVGGTAVVGVAQALAKRTTSKTLKPLKIERFINYPPFTIIKNLLNVVENPGEMLFSARYLLSLAVLIYAYIDYRLANYR